MPYDPFHRLPDKPQPQRKPLQTFQKGQSIYTGELVSHDGIGTEARVFVDGELLVSRRFPERWQTIQWADEERKFIENGGDVNVADPAYRSTLPAFHKPSYVFHMA
jgi:hypothetical protein